MEEETERKSRFERAKKLFSSNESITHGKPKKSKASLEQSMEDLNINEKPIPQVQTNKSDKNKDADVTPPPIPGRPTITPLSESQTSSPPVPPKSKSKTKNLRHLHTFNAYKRAPLIQSLDARELPGPFQPANLPATITTPGQGVCFAITGNRLVISSLFSLRMILVSGSTGDLIWRLPATLENGLVSGVSSLLINSSNTLLVVGTLNGAFLTVDLESGEIKTPRQLLHQNRPVIYMVELSSGDVITGDMGGLFLLWPKGDFTVRPLSIQMPVARCQAVETIEKPDCLVFFFGVAKSIFVFRYMFATQVVMEMGAFDSTSCGIGKIGAVVSIQFLPGCCESACNFVSVHEDGKIMAWYLNGLGQKEYLGGINLGPYRIQKSLIQGNWMWVFLSTGKIQILALDGCRSPESWSMYAEWKGHASPILLAAFAEGLMISMSEDCVIGIWDARLRKAHLYKHLRERQEGYSSFTDEKVLVCSWNVAAQKPPSLMETKFWSDWLGVYESPAMIAVGLQEVMELESKRAHAKLFIKNASGGPSRLSVWIDRLTGAVAQVQTTARYRLQLSQSLVGLILAVFVREDLSSQVSSVSSDSVKTGLGGLHGNKGSIGARILFGDTSLGLMNVHLAAGHEKVASRNADAGMIIRGLSFNPCPQANEQAFTSGDEGRRIDDLEHVIFFGDLNYRIDASRSRVIKELSEDNGLQELSKSDQLLAQFGNPDNGFVLASFKESPLAFPPTYKFDLHSDAYDTSEKARCPAWCDRILYRCNNGLADSGKEAIEKYGSIKDVRISDHRPVYAVIRIPKRTIDPLRYRQILNRLSTL